MVSLRGILGTLRRGRGVEEIRAKNANGDEVALFGAEGDDIAQIINDALEAAGQDGQVLVENGRYLRDDGRAVSTQVETVAEGQTLDFRGSDIELADGAGISSMLRISHASVQVEDVNLLGNRANNPSLNAVVDNTPGVTGPTFADLEIFGAPDGILLDDVTNADVRNSGTGEANQDVDNAIRVINSQDITLLNAKLSGFTADGVRLENSNGVITRALGVTPASDADANNAIHVLGCRDCSIGGNVRTDGGLDKGLRDEAYDVGGSDERTSDANIFDMVVNGVTDIGFHISDAGKERVRGLVDGEQTTGRTTQAFLVDDPNGLVNPQHDIGLDGSTLTRVTDTNQTDSNDGMRVSGHFSKVNNTATYGAGGRSVTDFTFGEATPNPVFNVVTGTTVDYQHADVKTTTDNNGQVSIDWSDDYHFEDKPILSVTIEQAGQWHVASYSTDGSGRFTGATIQVTDSSGTAVAQGIETNAKIVGA